MTQYERELSNLSYTNKDFQQIYPELLDLVKKISYKWDPSTSDESDPGVVLLKLAALMADKNNYNIDKNILELFPLSVTQEANARQIFDQCGYSMKYYRSATTEISFTMINEPAITEEDLAVLSPSGSVTSLTLSENINTRVYKIPMFTMVSDTDNEVVYTITKDVSLKSDGVTVSADAIQGTVCKYTVNGDPKITTANLDYNNRLYFTEKDIAQNGIFITHVDSADYDEWRQVENLVIQPIGTLCYKFGLTDDGSLCYIEFPSDIDNIIQNGLNITYVRTFGLDGNIGKKRLNQFFVDTTATRYIESELSSNIQEVVVTSENINVTNILPSVDGKNPESIDEAYRNYQKIKGTFETLVSLKDYTDFLYSDEAVSNCFVCDRTNDVQSSYKVLESDTNYTKTHKIVKSDTNGNPELTPFDLKVYGLTYFPTPATPEQFNRTFSIINTVKTGSDEDTNWFWAQEAMEDIKSIQHNFKQFLPYEIVMLKNKFPIICRIVPTYKLLESQSSDIISKVTTALYDVLNSRMLNFGDEADYSMIYDTISAADPRIKAVVLDDFSYETWASYYNPLSGKIEEVRIDEDAPLPEESSGVDPSDENSKTALQQKFRKQIVTRSILAGVTQLFEPEDPFTYSLQNIEPDVHGNITHVTTNTDFDLEFTQADSIMSRKEVGENENIILTAPNYINVNNGYSSYVKFIHNVGGTVYDGVTEKTVVVKRNQDYELSTNEFIMFFWKTEDDDTAPYKYYKYSGGATSDANIINSTNALVVQPRTEDEAFPYAVPFSLLASLPDGEGTTSGLSVNSTDGVSPVMDLTSFIGSYKFSGSQYVLTGSHTITPRRLNRIHINNTENGTNNVFWILNSVKDGRCELFTSNTENERSHTYTLQSGEYFIYSNASRTQIVMLGQGTVISRTGNTQTSWSVEQVSYNDFIAEGLDYIDSPTSDGNSLTKWWTIDKDTDVYATEMLFHQLGPETKLTLTYNGPEETRPKKIRFSNSGVYAIPHEGAAEEPVNLAQYTISYQDSEGKETTLPVRTNDSLAWTGKSILNINTSPTNPQKLEKHQYIEVKQQVDDEAEPQVLKFDGTKYFMADRYVNITGGIDVDVTSLDIYGNLKKLLVYIYNLFDTSFVKDVEYTGFTTLVKISRDDDDVDFTKEYKHFVPFAIPEGDYIVPIQIQDSSVFNSLSVEYYNGKYKFNTVNSVPVGLGVVVIPGKGKTDPDATLVLEPLIGDKKKNTWYTENGTYYFKLPHRYADGYEWGAIVIREKHKGNSPSDIVIKSPHKYVLNPDIDGNYVQEVTDDVISMSHDLFNYTYIVPDDIEISNPLNSSTFFMSQHVYNPYTISQWIWNTDTSKKPDMIVTNKIK